MKRLFVAVFSAAIMVLSVHRLPAPILEQPTLSPTSLPKSTRAETAPEGVKPGDIIAKITQLETKWESCVAAHDLSVVRSLVADDFSGVDSRGKVVNKSQLLEEFGKDSDTYSSASNQDLNVQVHGSAMAVAIGTAHEIGKSQNGKPFDRRFRFTDTWMFRHGSWQCTASQVSRLN